MSSPYENIKTLQQAIRLEQGRKTSIEDLIVLAPHNDPFYAGSETQVSMAEWFAGVFGQRSAGVHLRRLHYRLLARGDTVRADGLPYENDSKSWAYLNSASRFARYLGLVDPEDLVDRRNPAPRIYMSPGAAPELGWDYEVRKDELDRIIAHLGNYLSPTARPVSIDPYVSLQR